MGSVHFVRIPTEGGSAPRGVWPHAHAVMRAGEVGHGKGESGCGWHFCYISSVLPHAKQFRLHRQVRPVLFARHSEESAIKS